VLSLFFGNAERRREQLPGFVGVVVILETSRAVREHALAKLQQLFYGSGLAHRGGMLLPLEVVEARLATLW
jgi:hypothetical protein